MKIQFSKMFYTFIFVMVISILTTSAQIIYVDVNPDDTIYCSSSGCTEIDSLDIDNDGSIDFVLSSYYLNFGSCTMQPPKHIAKAMVTTMGANSFFGIDSTNPSALNYGDTIDDNLTWSNGEDTLKTISHIACTQPFSSTGNWIAINTDYYLPIKMIIAGNNHFGWIRMRNLTATAGPIKLVLEDYAYNSTPNQLIHAGDTVISTTGVNQNINSSSIMLFPNPTSNYITIQSESEDKNIKIDIVDFTGKIFYSAISDKQKTVINTDKFANGIYLVRIQTADFTDSKKLIVEN